MKRDFFYILFGLMLMMSATLFAETTLKEIVLHESKGMGILMPTDSPEQSSDDPPRPNQFHAYIAGQTLSFKIANSNLNHVIVHSPSGVVMLDVRFVGDTAFVLPTLGQHIVEIQNARLHLVGDFNLDPNCYLRSGEPNEPPMTLSYTIDTVSDCYYIEVEFPCFQLAEVVLPNDTAITAQSFEKMVYPGYAYSCEPFDYGTVNGQPKMPFLSLNLQIPDGATVEASVESINYYNDIYLNYQYAPVQDVPETGDYFPLQYDDSYYSSGIDNVWDTSIVVSEPYLIRGTTGINVQFRPALYFPNENILRPINRMTYSICVDNGDMTLSDMHDETLETPSLNDMINFYDTYRHIDTIVHPEYKGNLLILATEDYEEKALEYADHKNSLGFNAWVETLDHYMLDSTFIRHYIKSWYDYEECRPKYILLIGDEIPYSTGELNNISNPPTDMYYACVDEYYTENEDITPDIYVGRWPVHNTAELEYIILKSEGYDGITTPNNRMVLFSGTDGDKPWMEECFVKAIDDVYNIVHDSVPSIYAVNYVGRNGFDSDYMRYEFYNYNNSFFVYRGHGSPQCFGNPYQEITMFDLPHNLPYFNFGFGCKLNYPDGFGTAWVNIGDRSCTFYGATVNTYSDRNTPLQINMFRGLKNNKNITIGELVYNGVRKANNIRVEKIGLTAYVLNGDPSLYIYGTRLFGDVLQHSPANDKNAEDLNNIELSEDVNNYALYTISGTLVYSHSGSTDNLAADIDAQNLQDGIYILSIQTRYNSISSQKIIIQH